MILTCPNCGTQYVVKDGAIPPEGRQVRCAACKHSWHQDPEAHAAAALEATAGESVTSVETPPAAVVEPAASFHQSGEDESLAEATLIDPRSGPETEERAYEESVIEGETDVPQSDAAPVEAETPTLEAETQSAEPASTQADWAGPTHGEPASDMFNPFADNGEAEPRRRSPLVAFLIVALIVILAAAAFWFFAPSNLKARLGLAASDTTALELVVTHKDRQPLESGNELLTITGRVINPTAKEQVVPPLQAQLLDSRGKVVYSWRIDPPARSIPAGGSVGFNSAEVNVPAGGNNVRITLGPPLKA
jgi:predicted Zn finger-like uncharacterized protein